jgi:hypothetical protein
MNERIRELAEQVYGSAHYDDFKFAALVAAHEREQSAKIVENYCGAWDDQGYALASAIRKRGQE